MTPIVCSGPAVHLRRHVAASAADGHDQLELPLVGEVRDLEVGVEDLEVGRQLHVRRRHRSRPLLLEPHLDLGRLAVQAADEVLEVEQDVGDVFAHARQRRELVGDALELHRRDGCALERREQHAAQRVAERVAEATVERLDREDAALLVDLFVDDARGLELHEAGTGCHVSPSFLVRAGRYFE